MNERKIIKIKRIHFDKPKKIYTEDMGNVKCSDLWMIDIGYKLYFVDVRWLYNFVNGYLRWRWYGWKEK